MPTEGSSWLGRHGNSGPENTGLSLISRETVRTSPRSTVPRSPKVRGMSRARGDQRLQGVACSRLANRDTEHFESVAHPRGPQPGKVDLRLADSMCWSERDDRGLDPRMAALGRPQLGGISRGRHGASDVAPTLGLASRGRVGPLAGSELCQGLRTGPGGPGTLCLGDGAWRCLQEAGAGRVAPEEARPGGSPSDCGGASVESEAPPGGSDRGERRPACPQGRWPNAQQRGQ